MGARRRRRTRRGDTPRSLCEAFSRRYARFPASDRGGSMLSFGVTVLPDPPYHRMIELMTLAERHGFEYAWTYDSHILWEESYATLPLAAAQTSKIKLGHFVTNPGIRDPTITASWYATMQDISDGRMVMGIGRGDSSRRVVGLKPVRVAEFESRCAMIKDLMNGRSVDWNEKELELKWVREELPDIPMWIAGYGPKALAVAGRVADGVIIQLADPVIIQWIMDTARRAAEEAGRDPSELKCIVGASSHISDDIADAREQSRFGAKHGEFVTDEIVDRFCVLGTAEACAAKLKELESIGVVQFNVYLMTHGQEDTLKAYGEEIIPQFSGVGA